MNLAKTALLVLALGGYAALLRDDLEHPERLLQTRAAPAAKPPPGSSASPASSATLSLSWVVGLQPPPAASFREPARDVFSYKERPPAPPPRPRPPPPPPPPAEPRRSRIDRARFELHGLRDRPGHGQREAFLSVDGVLFIVREGDSLAGGLRVGAVGLQGLQVRTAEGDEEVELSLR
ncbi:MAG: hypothetical protein HY816_20730 [Candidatus Wallbacteria bacterium]|nr:hypothetical protein [Candidatus Wallbacteria bacterium]